MTPQRERATQSFSARLELPLVARLIQRGRDPSFARYTLEFADGRLIPIGSINNLWSQAEFFKVLAVSIGAVPYTLEQKEWRQAVRVLIKFATDVIDTPGETYAETVLEFVRAYTERAGIDRDEAASAGAPFIEDGYLHVKAEKLAVYIRRELVDQVKLTELYQALRDLGFTRQTINYQRAGRRRTTASYYRAPITVTESASYV